MKPPKPLTQSFGLDMSDELNINDLKKSLPVHSDFILFDACYMGSIEVLYELREKMAISLILEILFLNLQPCLKIKRNLKLYLVIR